MANLESTATAIGIWLSAVPVLLYTYTLPSTFSCPCLLFYFCTPAAHFLTYPRTHTLRPAYSLLPMLALVRLSFSLLVSSVILASTALPVESSETDLLVLTPDNFDSTIANGIWSVRS